MEELETRLLDVETELMAAEANIATNQSEAEKYHALAESCESYIDVIEE